MIAPGRQLLITDSCVAASPFTQPGGERTAIDLFFRSLAAEHGDGFAVVLSGSGSDGAVGAKAVKESGGLVLVQDPSEAGHGGMPRAAIATGVADVVLPVRDLVTRLAELARAKHRINPVVRAPDPVRPIPEDEDTRSSACSTRCGRGPVTTSRATSAERCCAACRGACSSAIG